MLCVMLIKILWYKEELEDTKGAIRIHLSKRISKKNRQHNSQKEKYKRTYKTKDRVTRTPLKTGVNWGAPEG
jgi:hypothetical protein